MRLVSETGQNSYLYPSVPVNVGKKFWKPAAPVMHMYLHTTLSATSGHESEIIMGELTQ